MIKFNKIMAIILLFLLSFGVFSNVIMYHTAYEKTDKGYMVEINRIYHDITRGTDPKNVKLDGYRYIMAVKFLSIVASNNETATFFSTAGLLPHQEYFVKPMIIDDDFIGYLRFEYENNQSEVQSRIMVIYNIFFIGMVIFALGLLIYIKSTIIKPFHEIHEMPYELSKGHLSKGLKESKNRFFGKFLWGLDLLRESLESHKKRELQLEKEKKTLILSISHDIKTPLSTIKLYSKALYDNLYVSEEKKREAAYQIEREANQIEKSVEEIVESARTDLFDIQVIDGEFYLKDFIERIQKNYNEKLKILKINFIIENYNNRLLKGDIDRLLEVFENIIENAIKYGDGKQIKFSFSEEDYCQLITVSNTGTCIPDIEFVHMFESFWRGSNAHEKLGNGLGLYICKHIMSKMNGDVFAKGDQEGMHFVVVVKES